MRTTALAIALLCSASAALAQQPPQPPPTREESVVEAARRARNLQRPQAKPEHVYTADDLPRLRLIPLSIVGQLLPEDEESATGTAGRAEDPETIWRARFAEARSQITDAERAIATTQRNFDDAGRRAALLMDWNFLTCPSDGNVFAPGYTRAGELNSRCADLNQAKERLAQARANLASLEEEFRRAGLPPGWARE